MNSRYYPVILLIVFGFLNAAYPGEMPINLPSDKYGLRFNALADRWDEAIPLGNGMLGALIWQNGENLRISLNRADLWDLRPMANLDKPEWNFKWVYQQWKNENYSKVQEYFDRPYDRDPAPSKIPAGALEFAIRKLGEVEYVRLRLVDAVCEVKWKNGVQLSIFVHATKSQGWYRFEGLRDSIRIALLNPPYNLKEDSGVDNPVTGQDLRRLGYPEGVILYSKNSLTYNQEGWGGFTYQIHTKWEKVNNVLTGCWSISSQFPGWKKQSDSETIVKKGLKKGFSDTYNEHQDWWLTYWTKSSLTIPDSLLQNQYYMEMYKFGSAARKGAPPISLQSVWTADNGRLPPWKGDFHHDLNTQLSYWPAYTGNHLGLEEGFLDWLWKNKPTFEKYTTSFYGTNGLNVPGVSTLTGEPMGGWIQYSFGPTVSAWLGHHFYLHWRYSRDESFLKNRVYPWIKDVATYLYELSDIDIDTGLRKLPLSSSPEIFNNSREAWFAKLTNFDLALIRWTFEKAAELARELNYKDEAALWSKKAEEWPEYAIDEGGLMFAPGHPYDSSHRHFSHLMAYHPLGLIDWSQGQKSRKLIQNTLSSLEKYGYDKWVGYSFSWLGNLYARAFNGEEAARALRLFAECFCLKNSFHVNGDQSGRGIVKGTYRPFTLEGNFAFAAGIQEMLLQSHTDVITIFPAIPSAWEDLSFNDLRAQGAFLVSADRKQGRVEKVKIISEKGQILRLNNPFKGKKIFLNGEKLQPGVILEDVITMPTRINQEFVFTF